jgi:hypothetical protein
MVNHQEVSLAHLAREVDVQSSHLGSSPHRREFGFLFSKTKIVVGASPTAFPFKKKIMINHPSYFQPCPPTSVANTLELASRYCPNLELLLGW